MSIVNVARPDAFHRKPLRHQTELNPQGRLRENLLMATLFEPGPWQRDYVNPGMTFTANGLPAYGDGQQGGTVAAGVSGYLALSPPPLLLSPFSWTVSISMLFTGAAPAQDVFSVVDDSTISYFFIQGAPNLSPGSMTFFNSVIVGSWNAANYTGWHRVTVSAPLDASGTFYFDGVSQGSASFVGGVPGQPMSILGGGGRTSIVSMQFSDIFLWNSALTASQVAAHTADPYGTTLRPRYAEFGRVASAAAGAKRKPSLMTTGVGP